MWRDRPVEIPLDRRERVVGDDDVRPNPATTHDRATRVRLEGRSWRCIALERIGMDFDELSARQQLSLAVDRPPAWRIPLAGRDLEQVAVLQLIDGLNETLPERRRA